MLEEFWVEPSTFQHPQHPQPFTAKWLHVSHHHNAQHGTTGDDATGAAHDDGQHLHRHFRRGCEEVGAVRGGLESIQTTWNDDQALDGKKRWGAIQRMRQFIKNPSKITKCRQFQCRILQLAQRNVSKSGQEMQPTCISNATRIHKVVARLVINSFLCLWMVYGNYLHWIS